MRRDSGVSIEGREEARGAEDGAETEASLRTAGVDHQRDLLIHSNNIAGQRDLLIHSNDITGQRYLLIHSNEIAGQIALISILPATREPLLFQRRGE